jgi:predicted nuclease of predicted toxin-antitoxin system
MDEHVPSAITDGLRLRGIEVLTIQEDGRCQAADDLVIARATELGRLLFSRDKDMLRLGTQFQNLGRRFSGIVYAHQQEVSIGQCVSDLSLICQAGEAEELANRVLYLPLR